jgi:pimeloyl-ACP methyl ester carboxylesterase
LAAAREAVVLVHGLWLYGWSLALQAYRLRRCGYDVHVFSWPTVRRGLRENAAALQDFLSSLDAPVVHLVGQSLGGVLIRALFHYFPAQRPGRIVTWGSPHGGSRAAASIARFFWGRWMLGKAMAELLAGETAGWSAPAAELGTLCGDLPIGFGAVVADLARPHDGVVTVAEARLAQATDSLSLRVSHMGMLVARAVARQTCQFLRAGRFRR